MANEDIHAAARVAEQSAGERVYDEAIARIAEDCDAIARALATSEDELASAVAAHDTAAATVEAQIDDLQVTVMDQAATIAQMQARIDDLLAQLPEPEPGLKTRIGVYNGEPNKLPDERTMTVFGSYPEIASTYYQTDKPGLNLAYETARIKRGTAPLLTVTTKSGPVTLAEIGARSARGEAFLTTYIRALKTLSEVDASVPVYATLDHEFEVKRNEAKAGNADRVAFKDVTNDQYAAALSRFLERCHAEAPKVVTLYWYGYSDWGNISAIQAKLTTKPKAYSMDPYRWRGALGSSFDAAILAKVRQARAAFGADARVGISEFGASEQNGDASNAVWFTGIRKQLESAGVEFACLFNRGEDVEGNLIDNDPLTRVAFAAELKH